jgi:hypothetical protein
VLADVSSDSGDEDEHFWGWFGVGDWFWYGKVVVGNGVGRVGIIYKTLCSEDHIDGNLSQGYQSRIMRPRDRFTVFGLDNTRCSSRILEDI